MKERGEEGEKISFFPFSKKADGELQSLCVCQRVAGEKRGKKGKAGRQIMLKTRKRGILLGGVRE